MSVGTSIEWCTATWNPTRGCSRVSLGCGGAGRVGGCYAERMAHRFSGPGRPYEGLTRMTANGPRWTGVVRLVPEVLDEPLRWRKPQRVFVNSMSDLFHEALPFEDVERVYRVMAEARQHTFQVLTKRPERRRQFVAWVHEEARRAGAEAFWPLPNVWEGVSVEDQATADERIPLLLQTSAAVRFVSYEPALGPVDFGRYYFTTLPGRESRDYPFQMLEEEHRTKWIDLLDWVIVGGESGPGARPFDVAWARSTVQQCRAAGVAAFCKQLGADVRWNGVGGGGLPIWEAARAAVDTGEGNWRVPLRDRKGGDPAEWPEDLRVREFPAVAA